jgi:predicted ribosomally synthesized peptide with SipW-like signal peptide
MKKILLSVSMIAAVAIVVVGATGAFFNDTETSVGNIFTAGAIDLKVDNESFYNGVFNPGTSWDLKDLGDGDLFFNFLDLKPGDWGEDTISLHVNNNEAWACMDAELTATDDNGLTEPEEEDGDNTGGTDEGELQDQVNFVWWADDGDNVLEEDEAQSVFNNTTLSEFNNFGVPLADSTGQGILSASPLDPARNYYIGKAWCFGTFDLIPVPQDNIPYGGLGTNGPDVRSSGVSCNGATADNTAQTDSVVGNISFTVVQSRHNENFVCGGGGIGCLEKADVMLVLDRSGSIGSNMPTLKNAANAFVTSLNPTADGVHVGMVSFSSTASLDVHLTDNGAGVQAAINALVSGGLTNLEDALLQAQAELDNPGDGDDRPDGDSPDFIVLITDGAPTASSGPDSDEVDAANAAQAARNAGTVIYGVGVGTSPATATYLKDDIVTAPSATHYFDAADFAALQAILEDLADCPLVI